MLSANCTSLRTAVAVLRGGGTIIYPTETAYALGADPRNARAVRAVYAVKGRKSRKPLGLVAASRAQVQRICALGTEERRLAVRHWPGALSIVLRLHPHLPRRWSEGLSLVAAGGNTVSIRVSGSAWVRTFCRTLGFPIVATSANKSGKGEVFDSQTFNRMFDRLPVPDLLIDGGVLPASAMSTIVHVHDGKLRVLRRGAVQINELDVE